MDFKYEDWNIEEMTGYKPLTTYYSDFSIADKYGEASIQETYDNAIETCKGWGYKYFTELVMALNWKIWRWYEENEKYGRLYDKLWKQAESEYLKFYKKDKEAIEYYYRTTD